MLPVGDFARPNVLIRNSPIVIIEITSIFV